MMNELLHGNCLELMSTIPEKSVDMVLCDLPYGQTKNLWDQTLPLEYLWNEWHRIIKPNAAVVLFGQGMFTCELMQSNPKEWRYNLIWKKGDRSSGFLNAEKMPLRNHEDILVFYRQQPVYHPQMRRGIPLHSRGRIGEHRFKNSNYGKFREADDSRAGMTDKYPISVIEFDRPHPPIHPTQKPVELLEYLVRMYTDEGALVLDNTMGSGSTGVACVNTKRQFIGIELNEEYFNIAQQRVKSAEIEMMSRLF